VIEGHAANRRSILELRLGGIDTLDSDSADQVWKELRDELRAQEESERFAREADAALGILDDYAALLARLTSDEFTAQLEEESRRLGTAVSDGVAAFNRTFGGSVPSFGPVVAGVVRGLGGAYVRRQQTILLKDHVAEGDPVVAALTRRVEELLTTFVRATTESSADGGKIDLQPWTQQEEDKLAKVFRKRAMQERRASDTLIDRSAAILEDSEKTRLLGETAVRAAQQYREAHHELLAALSQRADLKQRIEEIRVLAGEIKAARKLMKDLES
jgi:hypothetical protein